MGQVSRHVSWARRALFHYGGDFLELQLRAPEEWRRLCATLSDTCAGLARLGGPAASSARPPASSGTGGGGACPVWRWHSQAVYSLAAPPALELRWTLVLPGPQGSPDGVLAFDGAACRLTRLDENGRCSTQALWRAVAPGPPQPLRAVAGVGRFYLLANPGCIEVYDLASRIGALRLPPSAGGSDEKRNLLSQATDLFLSDDGGHVVLETPSRLLVWETGALTFKCELAPRAGAERLQSRPAGEGTVALWDEEGGVDAEVWELEWEPPTPTPNI